MQKIPKVGHRLASMLLDHAIIGFALSIVLAPFLLTDSFLKQPPTPAFDTTDWLMMIALLVVYGLKDSFNGKSLAKRILKLQVIDERSGNVASPLQCFVRNLLIPFWPIEVAVTLFNPQRRIGDRLAKTKVVSTE